MKPSIIGRAIQFWQVELPYHDSVDMALDYVLPRIEFANDKPVDIEQAAFAVGSKRWHEIQHDDTVAHTLHIFEPDGSYILSHEGNVLTGEWRMVNPHTLTIKMEKLPQHELFDLIFISPTYLVLKKHGSHSQKYLFLGVEHHAVNKTSYENLQSLYSIRNQNLITMAIILFVVFVLVLICWILFF